MAGTDPIKPKSGFVNGGEYNFRGRYSNFLLIPKVQNDGNLQEISDFELDSAAATGVAGYSVARVRQESICHKLKASPAVSII